MLDNILYPLDRFETLLASRGILRTKVDHGEGDLSPPSDLRDLYLSRELRVHTRSNHIVDSLQSSQLPNESSPYCPDVFYCSESFERLVKDREFDPADDLFFTYRDISETCCGSDLSILKKSLKDKSDLVQQSIKENYEAYHLWEHHDSITEKEISLVVDNNFGGKNSDAAGNGGVYHPSQPELSSSKSERLSQFLQLAPAAKFRDLIDIECQNMGNLNGLDSSLKYKNNLSAIIRDKDNTEYLLVCCQSEILVFEFDEQMNIPRAEPSLTITTRPPVTSARDRISLTWPFFPHTLNSIISRSDWLDGPVVVACFDDGRVLIWHVANLVSCIAELKSKPKSFRYAIQIECDYSLHLNSSAWGVDVKTTIDIHGNKHHILAASANNKRITLFYFHENVNHFFQIETHSVLHNIPEVSVISYIIRGVDHHAVLACATIFGELITFKFEFRLAVQAVTTSTTEELKSKRPIVTRRTCLGSDCWTSKPIHSKYFKKVQSLRAMTGNHNIDEEVETSRILTESKMVSPVSDSSSMSDLGVASRWQFFETPVVNLASQINPQKDECPARFCSFQEECKRMFLIFKNIFEDDKDSDFAVLHDTFLAVSTDRKLGLFRADTLLCIAATKEPFDFNFSTDEENKWCNRILISELVPELLAFIAVTQLGLVTIMRFCEHRGVYGMRQEYLFPNAKEVCAYEGGIRTIIGISVRNLSPLISHPRFFLYIIYSDGHVLTYRLQNRTGGWEI